MSPPIGEDTYTWHLSISVGWGQSEAKIRFRSRRPFDLAALDCLCASLFVYVLQKLVKSQFAVFSGNKNICFVLDLFAFLRMC